MSKAGAMAAALGLGLSLPAAGQVRVQKVAMTGEEVPGFPGVYFSGFGDTPVINDLGEVRFSTVTRNGTIGAYYMVGRPGDLKPLPVPPTRWFPSGLSDGAEVGSFEIGSGTFDFWIGKAGEVRRVAGTGMAAPGMEDGFVFRSFASQLPGYFNSGGTQLQAVIGASASRSPSDVGPYGIWVATYDAVGLIAHEGQQAPGMPPGTTFETIFKDLTPPAVNRHGQVSFHAWLRHPDGRVDTRATFWGGASGHVRRLSMPGEQAPGLPPGLAWNGPSGDFDEFGQLSAWGSLSGADVNENNDSAIWVGAPGELRLIYREGDPIVGAEGLSIQGATLRGIAPGRVAIHGSLEQDDASMGRAVLVGEPSSVKLIAREGPAPGMSAGIEHFGLFLDDAADTRDGARALLRSRLSGAGIDDTNDDALWLGTEQGTTLLLREGDPASGLNDPGITWRGWNFWRYEMNELGQVVFSSPVQGPGIDESNDQGIWMSDPNGDLHLVAREGGLFDIGNGVLKEVERLSSSGVCLDYDDSCRFSDTGQFAFALSFTDGSAGIFTAAVPEPASSCCLTPFGVALLRRRRRK